jgi:hypothetical protein
MGLPHKRVVHSILLAFTRILFFTGAHIFFSPTNYCPFPYVI